MLGLAEGTAVRSVVQQAFRDALRDAHPDHGADHDSAAHRIAELSEARRILLQPLSDGPTAARCC